MTVWSRASLATWVVRCLRRVWSTKWLAIGHPGHRDERMDVAPVVLGSGKGYFGSVDAQHMLEDPDVVIRGDRVLHLRYRVRR